MKLACQEHLVPGHTLEEKVDWLARHGFSGIELWAFDIRERVKEIQAVFRGSPIAVTSLVGGYDGHLFHPSAQERETAIAGVRRLIGYAGEIGAGGVVIVPAFGIPRSPGVLTPHPPATPEEIASFGETLGQLALAAEDAGVSLFAEVINRYESPAFNTVSEMVRAMDVSGSSRLKLLVDTFHMNIEEHSLSGVIAQHLPRIGYVHLSDSNRRVPGRGHLDFGQVLRSLQAGGYAGYLTLECFLESAFDLLNARDYLLRLWKAGDSS
ncbi:sugar phosphate isomerase/epimerase [Brevibacillus sp. SYP-B805]|uniref:sugar phosphate isomerase/epimerase family protein n=1 Tax=Brevibacillus sp. SYP-B805 TaxID=1578199 RepID=UPI0013EC6AF1|nr:sugar phosphate isomerase/epimerase family protein [Brevibacillus sp. SYP-B805]NGQ93744.1 sugar phosphate isomerase/epimerase [Brevibacillus sp. SYP-B805]